MQYRSQQPPENQPHYPPSEIYVYEQPQAYAPQPYVPTPEITQPPAPLQEIAIYVNRGQAIWRGAVSAFGLLLLFLLFIPLFILIASTWGDIGTNPFEAPVLLLIAFAVIFLLAAIAYIGWINWGMFSGLVFSQKPLMVINREGITVGRIPSLSGFSIAWSEIGTIFIRRSLYKYFCIAPKNPDLYLRRFNVWERWIRRSNALIGIPSLVIPQVFLNKPVEEILQALYHTYLSELSYYGIQLRS